MQYENTLKWQQILVLNFFHSLKVTRILAKKASTRSPVTTIVQKLAPNKLAHGIRLEISLEKMNELLMQKQICAEDIRCLDPDSKQYLMELCLQNCLIRHLS
ncbi:MAG: hypothetical protein GQ583_06150 [Methyloprofundus sp.]|nr:hypothetical protein [Methyloprofundus sp.]